MNYLELRGGGHFHEFIAVLLGRQSKAGYWVAFN